MIRCQHQKPTGRLVISVHRTLDSKSVSDAATNGRVALFPSGHYAVCNCEASEGKMKPEDCDGLAVYDAAKKEVARFSGRQFGATTASDGSVVVFKVPQTQDSETKGTSQFGLRGGIAIDELNRLHTDFYRSGKWPAEPRAQTGDTRNKITIRDVQQMNEEFYRR
jgi:hypothetical protein